MVRVLGVYARGRHHYFRELIQVDCRPGAPYRTGRNGTDHLTDVTSTRRFARRKKAQVAATIVFRADCPEQLNAKPSSFTVWNIVRRYEGAWLRSKSSRMVDMEHAGEEVRWKAHAVSSSQEKKKSVDEEIVVTPCGWTLPHARLGGKRGAR